MALIYKNGKKTLLINCKSDALSFKPESNIKFNFFPDNKKDSSNNKYKKPLTYNNSYTTEHHIILPNYIPKSNKIIIDTFQIINRTISVIDKNTFSGKFKGYILPSGKITIIQGYEPFALDILLKTYHEDQLFLENKVPTILWTDSSNIIHRYTADIYIPSENKLIEIKSNWTFKLAGINNKNKLAPLACIAQGYTYEYWIFDKKGNREIISQFSCN
jgi:hypothetical protein